MSTVRVIARIRPLLKTELYKDVILENIKDSASVRLPNPRNDGESYKFEFASVYDQDTTQQELFDAEISPTVKSLFKGLDVTIFAYGVTGTGKTHTMRGGKTLTDRGVIPRLLSSIYRRARKIEKDAAGETTVRLSLSYYEIYCDRVYDLFEGPEKRTPAGLPIRDNGGRSVVVGLTERPCTSLKEFEQLYDQANMNRSTSATKLNAHSSRSHAILSVKISQTTGDEIRTSTVSAIDLAGSEDNRRTENAKDRMVESAAINKSLFVLAQCVEAISKKQTRIPYRESRMTRILSLGQNNGITVMILNLAPVKSYHLDTLSSLNFANRTKKIEVHEIENLPQSRSSKPDQSNAQTITGPSIQRQPLRPKNANTNVLAREINVKTEKPVKSFAVYAEKTKPSSARTVVTESRPSKKRMSGDTHTGHDRPAKFAKTSTLTGQVTQESIEALIERKVNEKLASATMETRLPSNSSSHLSSEVQARLDALEKRVGSQETERSEGLQYLLMAKQHQVRGENSSALKMYQLALPFFPGNAKLNRKILLLEERLSDGAYASRGDWRAAPVGDSQCGGGDDGSVFEDHSHEQEDEDSFLSTKRPSKKKQQTWQSCAATAMEKYPESETESPRTKELLKIINTRDVGQIRLLKGVGAKKAELIVNCLCEMDSSSEVRALTELGRLKGVGWKGVEKMREGIAVDGF